MVCLCTIAVIIIVIYVSYEFITRRPYISDLHKRAIFITGCDSGFGAALARRLDTLGLRVFAGCQTEDGATKLLDETSPRVKTLILDVTNSDTITSAFEVVKDSLTDQEVLWAVVNNAGICPAGGPIEFQSRQAFSRTFNINVIGMAEVTRIFMPLLKKSQGRIVNMTSVLGLMGLPFNMVYTASKFASEGLSDALRRSVSMWGISVHIIEPQLYKTSLSSKNYIQNTKDQWNSLPADVRAEYGEEYHQKNLASVKKTSTDAAPCLDPVIDAYEHALLARRPRLRYQVGLQGHILYVLSLLPAQLSDLLLSDKPLAANR